MALTKLILTLLLASASSLFAQEDIALVAANQSAPGGGGGSNPPASPLVNQNFEGAGYDNAETWSTLGGGTINPDATDIVLLGSQSFKVTAGDFVAGSAYISTAAGAERWGHMQFQITTSGNRIIAESQDSGFAAQIQIVAINGGGIRVYSGAVNATTSATWSTGTKYYLWWHYLKGTGTDAVAEVWFSTTTTKPADASAGHAKVTTGTSTADLVYHFVGSPTAAAGNYEIHIDHVYVDDEAILSNP